MAYKHLNYQYETSPKKLKPEYERKKKPYTKSKSSTLKVKQQKNTKQKPNIKKKNDKVKALLYILVGFAILFAISYRNSLITESFSTNQKLKSTLSTLQKENAQLEISIQNNLNLSNIEKLAKEKLGMQKISDAQKIYVTLPKKDYVEPASESVIIGEEAWYEKLLNSIKAIINY